MAIIITKEQKRILSYTAAGLFIILLFWGLIYRPARKQVLRISSEFNNLEEQLNKIKMIDEVKEAIAKGYNYTESTENLKAELSDLNKKIAAEEETSLEYISSSARRLNLSALSIKPGTKELLLDKNKNRIKIGNVDCIQLPVHLTISGAYNALGKYIEGLRKDAASLIAVENLKIGKGGKQDILVADIDLIIYLTSVQDRP